MPMKIDKGTTINNVYPDKLTKDQSEAAHKVIAQLQYADLFRDSGLLREVKPLMRVDMQGIIRGSPDRSNIQVQVNGVKGTSTVAHVDFARNLVSNDPRNQTGVVNQVIAALNKSLDDKCSYAVTGTAP